MIWHSPSSGAPLVADTAHSLVASGERWPVIDGIPYLRVGREPLAAHALALLDAGRAGDALVALLADQDDWWRGPATDPAELRRLVHERDALSLREAMALLRLGPVGDYFAQRWCDPTYLAGLALVEAHWPAPATAFELACGIGHYLRELGARGVACLGGDIVFAKCWLAKHWVAPAARYVVFDAGAPWPLGEARFDLVQCHDAFYFLPDQPAVAARLRACVAPGGLLAIGHLHNADVAGGASGPARPAAGWRAMFPDATVYDERAVLMALLRADAPVAAGWSDDPSIEAWSLVEGAAGPPRTLSGGLALPAPDAMLRRNPLLGEGEGSSAICWPSDRWREDYAAGCFWAEPDAALPPGVLPDPVRLRRLVALPARW